MNRLFEGLGKKFHAFFLSNSGATAIEYALIGGLISIAIVGAATLLSEEVSDMFNTISAAVQDATGRGGTPP